MIEKMQQLIQCDRRMTVVELEQEVGISHGSIHAILSDDLQSSKFVARQLTTDQMESRMMVAGDLFEKSTQDPTFLSKVFTGDESWVFTYDPETKVHSAEWHTSSSTRPKKSRLVKSKEVMLIAFFDIDSVVYHEFVPPGQTVNGHFYVQVLQRLRDALRRKQRDKWQGE